MFVVFTVLIVVTCIFTILIVLVQNSKGGGLASNFSSSNQYMGVRKTADFLEKATWGLAGALLFLAVIGSAFIPRDQGGIEQSRVQEQIETAVDPTQVPSFPITAPAATEQTTPAATEEEK